ncbi:hypothetical protein RB2150_05093 [Rhodobacterales bacterium HTCC2150]|nr:hypothetical protein RB2150_05093 [Rhodobacterales bacterium HTCC2150] [Rhodobacteraceae bacterium HTCC2150]
MNWVIFSVFLSHWRKQKTQFFGLFFGIALATGLWSGVQAINAEARASYANVTSTFAGQNLSYVTSTRDMTTADYANLRRSGWRVTPIFNGKFTRQDKTYIIIGVDFLVTALNAADQPEMAVQNKPLIFAHPSTAASFKDQRFDIRPRSNAQPGQLIMDISNVGMFIDPPLKFGRFIVLPNQPMSAKPLEDVDQDFSFNNPDTTNDISGLTDSFHLNLTAFGFLSFAVGLFIVQATIGLAFEQRRGTIRTLRAIGVDRKRLTFLMFAELGFFGIIAGCFGLILGYIIAAALLPGVAASLSGLYGVKVAGALQFRPIWALSGLGMTLFGILIAGGHTLWRMWHLPILRVANQRAWAMNARDDEKWRLIAVIFLFVLAVSLLLSTQGLFAGFVSLAAFMLGAALILPSILGVFLRLISSQTKPGIAAWFWADTRQQLPHLSLALMALLLALAANIGVNSMVSSFRITFTAWLDQRLAAELYVRVDNQSDQPRFASWIAPHVDAVLPLASVKTRFNAAPLEVNGIVNHATYRNNWTFIASTTDPWRQFANQKGVLINEQLALREKLTLGAGIKVSNEITLPVVGIYADYGNPLAQVTVSHSLVLANFAAADTTRYALRLDPNQVEELRQLIGKEFNLQPDAILNQVQIKKVAKDVFDQTFIVTNALNILTLMVAALAILINLATLAKLRLSQLAPVWAIGMARGDLALLELGRALALAVFTFIFALPLGIFLTWFLLSVINVAAFGWQLPLYYFPSSWGLLLLMTVLAAMLAAGAPAYQLWKRKPAEFLKVFASES